jgi:hypothetical protein
MIVALRRPLARISDAEPIASGRFDTKIAARRPTLNHRRPQVHSEHQVLGDPVEEGSEREAGSLRPRPTSPSSA